MTGRSAARGTALAVILAILALVTACSGRHEEAYAPASYTEWERTTGIVLDYPIPGHQDRLRIPRMNALGFTAKPRKVDGRFTWDFPEGTVIVKEVYATQRPGEGEKPVQLTIMAKEPGNPRSQSGWLWITKSLPDGEETVFTGNFCVTCHANANERHPYGDGNPNEDFRDFVFFVPGETGPVPREKAAAPAGTPGIGDGYGYKAKAGN